MNQLSILESVRQTFSKYPIGTIFTRQEILQAVSIEHNINKTSIIPSGYCYNITNLGKQADGAMDKFCIFEYISKSEYKYLGVNYAYSGIVVHRPKGVNKEIVVGEWKNGVYYNHTT